MPTTTTATTGTGPGTDRTTSGRPGTDRTEGGGPGTDRTEGGRPGTDRATGGGPGAEGPTRPRRGARLLATVLAAGTALALAGCSGSDDPDVPTPSISPTARPGSIPTELPTGLPTGVPTALPSSISTSLPGIGRVDAATGEEALRGTFIPADFPIPPGATVSVGATSGSRSTLTLEGVDSDAARDFYRQALPAAGYEITSDVGVAGVASSLGFRGKGVTGTIGAAGIGSADAIAAVFEKQ